MILPESMATGAQADAVRTRLRSAKWENRLSIDPNSEVEPERETLP